MNRRESLKLMAVASLSAAMPGCTLESVDKAAARVDGFEDLSKRKPSQMSTHEYTTLSRLVDYIIPADERSGGATDAHVPAFIDFMMEDTPDLSGPVKEALQWMDSASTRLFGSLFVETSEENNHKLLSQIAYPDDVKPDMEDGAAIFTTMRDLTASGFWSSKVGVEDLGYMGNTPQPSWDGCSHEAMEHIGLSYNS